MNWLDIVLALILVSALVGGVTRGLIATLFGFAGFALGLKLAGAHYGSLAGRLSFISNVTAANVVAFVIIWAAAMVLAALLAVLVKKAVSLVGLGWLDRLGGLVLGLGLGVFSCVLLVATILNFPLADLSGAVQGSKIASFLADRLAFFFALLPGGWGAVPFLPPLMPGIKT